jgi:hypothetical protein
LVESALLVDGAGAQSNHRATVPIQPLVLVSKSSPNPSAQNASAPAAMSA